MLDQRIFQVEARILRWSDFQCHPYQEIKGLDSSLSNLIKRKDTDCLWLLRNIFLRLETIALMPYSDGI